MQKIQERAALNGCVNVNVASFEKRIIADEEKKNYCKNNNIKLFYITYLDNIEQKLGEIIDELRL